MGTRISAQVRSHAQKVLKDYSPSSNHDGPGRDRLKSGVTEQDAHIDTMTLPKDQTMRTDEVALL